MNEKTGDFVSGLQEAVRQNPVSAALMGMGLVWMLTGGNRITAAAALLAPAARATANGVSEAVDAAKGATSTLFDNAQSLGERAVEQARGAAASAGESVGGLASEAYQVIKHGVQIPNSIAAPTAATARTAVSPLIASLRDTFERQPLLLGAIGIAIGTSIAAALPATRIEAEAMGDTADRMTAQAEKKAVEAAEELKHASVRAYEAVKSEASAQGLTADGVKAGVAALGDKMAKVASVARAAKT